jgi:outer membrane receptor protein involved in Fe transport
MLCLVVAVSAAEQRGAVVDARTRTPIAGAEVTLVGRRGSERTDETGRFRWTTAPQSPIEVIVVLPDGSVARPIRLEQLDPTGEITLAVEPAVAETVSIVGAAPTIDVTAGASTTFLSGAALATRSPATLSQAIDTVPGVSTVSEGQAAVPAIRGLARGRTLILVDGGRASTERRAGANASFLDPAAARSIEVSRGPGSVAYGSDAFGGVIAVRMRRPDYTAPLRVRFGGTVGGGVPDARGDLEVTTGYGSGGVLVAAHARDFGDYESPAGVVPNSGWRDIGARIAWEHQVGANRWSAAWQGDFGRDLGRPRSDSNMILTTSPFEDSHRVSASYERESVAGFRKLKIDGLIGTSDQRVEQDRLPAANRTRSVDRADLSFRDIQLRATVDRALRGIRLQAGADLVGRYGLEAVDTTLSYSSAGTVASTQTSLSIESAHRTGLGLFVQAETPVARRVRVSGGLRGDVVRTANTGGFFGDRSIANGALAGLLAMTWTPAGPLAITAQAARGFRDPLLSDRFYRGPVGRGFIEGNPNLRPETSLQFDLVARYSTARGRLAAAYYAYRIEDLVERYLVGATDFRFRNRGEALIRGGEVEMQLDLPAHFRVDATAQISRGRGGGDHTPLDDIAPDAVSATVHYAAAGRVNMTAYGRLSAVARHNLAGPSEVATPGYTGLEAGATWRISNNIELRGVARNLLNESYYSSAGPRWVYAPGRHGSLTCVVGFSSGGRTRPQTIKPR